MQKLLNILKIMLTNEFKLMFSVHTWLEIRIGWKEIKKPRPQARHELGQEIEEIKANWSELLHLPLPCFLRSPYQSQIKNFKKFSSSVT